MDLPAGAWVLVATLFLDWPFGCWVFAGRPSMEQSTQGCVGRSRDVLICAPALEFAGLLSLALLLDMLRGSAVLLHLRVLRQQQAWMVGVLAFTDMVEAVADQCRPPVEMSMKHFKALFDRQD